MRDDKTRRPHLLTLPEAKEGPLQNLRFIKWKTPKTPPIPFRKYGAIDIETIPDENNRLVPVVLGVYVHRTYKFVCSEYTSVYVRTRTRAGS